MYDKSSEYYDISELETWKTKKIVLGKISKLFANAQYPILDIGAGTGKVAIEVATNIKDAEILAVEPSLVMRTAFLSKLALHHYDDIRNRITIIPSDIQNFEYKGRIGGVICDGVIGHLSEEERRQLWRKLSEILVPNAPMFIGLLNPKMKDAQIGTMLSVNYVGKNRYETTIKNKECLGSNLYQWTLEYSIFNGDEAISGYEDKMKWQFIEMDVLMKELSDFGFKGGKISESMLTFIKDGKSA